MNLNISVTKKQKRFIDATEDEVLFGGAAGGGKSYGHPAFPRWGNEVARGYKKTIKLSFSLSVTEPQRDGGPSKMVDEVIYTHFISQKIYGGTAL